MHVAGGAHSDWAGLAQGLLVLGMLWWAWVGYAWLTSVVNPEEGAVRLVMFGAMAALLIVSLSVPHAFGSLALAFALSYGVVRSAQIALFILASPEDDACAIRSWASAPAPPSRRAAGLGIALRWPGSGRPLGARPLPRYGGPYFFGSAGWKLEPGHFAERHGLIMIIALGESIVAVGIGASGALDAGIAATAVLAVALASAMWWVYFDVVAIVADRRLAEAEPGSSRTRWRATPTRIYTW